MERIQNSPLKLLVSTDTVDTTGMNIPEKIKLISAAPLFAEAVRTIHDREPMAYMFGHLPERLFDLSFGGPVTPLKLD